MSNQSNGLRFDVYERVHLPDDVAAIDELEEIELVPRIQVIDQGDQAVLKGQLLLSGVYRSQHAIAGPLTLEHWIPVEISLPMNRVSRLDDISIEIDNFDVDLISARTLNITGVLSLRGISVDPVEDGTAQQWEEEPFTATHEREASFEQAVQHLSQASETYDPAAFISGAQAGDSPEAQIGEQQAWQIWQAQEQRDEEESIQAARDEQSYIAEETASEQASEGPREITIAPQQSGSDSWLQWSALAESGQKPSEQQAAQYPEEPTSLSEPWNAVSETVTSQDRVGIPAEAEPSPGAAEPISAFEPTSSIESAEPRVEEAPEVDFEASADQQAEQEARKPEVQIAFAVKPPSDGAEASNDVGFRALLQSSRREQAAREAAEQSSKEQQAQENEARTLPPEEEIEWKKLFLSKQDGENEFRKIRLCIVQKEETLEQIAIRYSLSPRDILNHNGLHESAIEEGQLLYIP